MERLTHWNVFHLAKEGKAYSDYPSTEDDCIRVLKYPIEIGYSFGAVVRIDAGFEWDEATVPAPLTWLFPKSGKYAFSALPHDIAYYGKFCSRAQADREFLMFSISMHGTSSAILRYLLVRVFGGIFWNRKPSKRAVKNKTKIQIL